MPSTPAVVRPALSSVTRRTATSALPRERSNNFCRLRTRLRSPARDAAKIRCRSRRTSSSAWRHWMASQSRGSSSGPFTSAPEAATAAVSSSVVSSMVVASNLPLRFRRLLVIESPQAHPTRVSTLSGPGIRPVSGRLCGNRWRRSQHRSFPVSRCLSATGIRFSGRPAPAAEFSLPHGRPTRRQILRLDLDGVVTFRTRQIRPGWVSSVPRGRWCASRPARLPRAAPAASQRPAPISR